MKRRNKIILAIGTIAVVIIAASISWYYRPPHIDVAKATSIHYDFIENRFTTEDEKAIQQFVEYFNGIELVSLPFITNGNSNKPIIYDDDLYQGRVGLGTIHVVHENGKNYYNVWFFRTYADDGSILVRIKRNGNINLHSQLDGSRDFIIGLESYNELLGIISITEISYMVT